MGEPSTFKNCVIQGAIAFDENGRAAVLGSVGAGLRGAKGELRQFDTREADWWAERGVATDAVLALPPLRHKLTFSRLRCDYVFDPPPLGVACLDLKCERPLGHEGGHIASVEVSA